MEIIENARVYTLDSQQPTASALAIEAGRIVGLADDPASLHDLAAGRPVRRVDAGGHAVLPGLTDAHLHLQHYAQFLQMVDCETATRAECLQRVRQRAAQTPKGAWVRGHGWNQNVWPESFGHAADLDAVAPAHPVYLTAKSLHAGWANTAALRLAGITAATPDPQDGRIGRDKHGQPDGLLFEGAMALVESAIPELSPEGLAEAILAALPVLWGFGLTGLHDFDRRTCFMALQRLHARGELRLRVVKSIPLELLPHAAALGLSTGFGDDILRIGSVKAFADGALGPQTGAMLQPYEGTPENRGMLFLDGEELFERGRAAVDSGLSLAVHAIGDRANHEVLKGYGQLRAYERQAYAQAPQHRPLRHRIEHVQVIHADDAGKLAELGVVASMQPIHATSDMLMADRFLGRRAALAYAWRTQLDYGAMLAFGSDAPVESPNPFWGLHAAVTRRRLDGTPGPQGWYPEQRLAVAEALRGYIAGPAYLAGMEDRLGRLAPGYLADLLILDTDPFTCEPEQLAAIRPLATMVAGEWVHGNP